MKKDVHLLFLSLLLFLISNAMTCGYIFYGKKRASVKFLQNVFMDKIFLVYFMRFTKNIFANAFAIFWNLLIYFCYLFFVGKIAYKKSESRCKKLNLMFNSKHTHAHIHTGTHTHIYIYIYIYISGEA